MAANRTVPAPREEAPATEWVKRLGEIVTAIEAMGPRERAATFAYLKSKYAEDWP